MEVSHKTGGKETWGEAGGGGQLSRETPCQQKMPSGGGEIW